MKGFKYIFMPSFWISVNPTCLEWDRILNRLLDEFEVTDISEHTCKIGKETIWINNYPYGFGRLYNDHRITELLPKKQTRERLYKKVKDRQEKLKEKDLQFDDIICRNFNGGKKW